jgi:hypothetical protein
MTDRVIPWLLPRILKPGAAQIFNILFKVKQFYKFDKAGSQNE